MKVRGRSGKRLRRRTCGSWRFERRRSGREAGSNAGSRGNMPPHTCSKDVNLTTAEEPLSTAQAVQEQSVPTPVASRWDRIADEYPHVFAEPDSMPPKRGVEHKIVLEPGSKPTYRPAIRMSPAEVQEARKQIADFMQKQPKHEVFCHTFQGRWRSRIALDRFCSTYKFILHSSSSIWHGRCDFMLKNILVEIQPYLFIYYYL